MPDKSALRILRPSPNEESAAYMRAVRKALNMSQRDLGFYLDVAINTISAWENGHTRPSPLADKAVRHLLATYSIDPRTLRRFEP
jgi:DNA-binding transcriptional regulator YiaG